jgi:hypothetical protein
MIKFGGWLCAVLLLAGCTAVDTRTPLTDLPPQARAQQVALALLSEVPEVNAPAPEPQDEDEDSGIILDMLIDGARARREERILAPLMASFDARRYERDLLEDLRTALAPGIVQDGAPVRAFPGLGSFLRAQGELAGNTLAITIRYGFSADFIGCYVEFGVSLGGARTPGAHARYVSEFVNPEAYGRWRLIERRAKNAEYWLRDDARAFNAALAQTRRELLLALNTDFRTPVALGARNRSFLSYTRSEELRDLAMVIETRGERVFVATPDARHWLDRVQIDKPQ